MRWIKLCDHVLYFFFFNDTATTEIYTLSLHDALPIFKANLPTRISFAVTSKIDSRTILGEQGAEQLLGKGDMLYMPGGKDRKSTRLNSSHANISYAVFCLKKKIPK